jgi:glycine/D-amino acid oxidase-like deaminating enzyme/nitrite reductase/ring-hydroxylating ferredoxin subunit
VKDEPAGVDRGSGRSRSVWMTGVELPAFGPLERNLEVDACVVGAGIAGLSVAYALAREGRTVAVLEDGATIGSGETARTTAHLVNAFDDRYETVARLHGEEAARLTAESHTAAIDSIEAIAREEGIDCDFERVDGYLFAPPGESGEVLARELEACHAAGLADVGWVPRAPLGNYDTGRCLRFPRQAQFHPLRYLAGLARALVRRGGQVFTGTHADQFEDGRDGSPARVTTRDGRMVTARSIVVATNAPVQNLLTLHTKQYAYRTYVIAAPVARGSVAPALFWDTLDPYHYVRLQRRDGDDLLLVGGEDHKTGQEPEGEDPHRRLELWARARIPAMGAIEYEWSGQVLEPVDALAFIGRNPGDRNLHVVTGDSGNGMTHGALAGPLLAALLAGRDHPWAKLYDPSRKSLRAALEFTRENVNMAAQYATWLTAGDYADASEIPLGSGGVIREGLHKIAVHRDRDGRVHRLSAVCPHLGAIVTWNREEGTWDCPAHGSRFDARGRVVNGPANGDLSPAPDEANAEGRPAAGEEAARRPR